MNRAGIENKTTQLIIEMLIASAAMIFFYFSGMVLFPLGWLLPAPGLIMLQRYGIRPALISLLAGSMIIVLTTGHTKDLLFQILIIGTLCAVASAIMLRENFPPNVATATIVLSVLVLVPVFICGTNAISDKSVRDEMEDSYNALTQDFLSAKESSSSKTEINDYKRMLETGRGMMMNLYPSIFGASILLSIFISLTAARRFQEKRGLSNKSLLKFTDFNLPDFIIALFVISGIGVLLLSDFSGFVALNLLIYTLMLYLLQGFSLLTYSMSALNISPIARFLSYMAIVLLPALIILVIALGMANVWLPVKKKVSDLKDKISRKPDF